VVRLERGVSTYSGYEIAVQPYIKRHLGTRKLNALMPEENGTRQETIRPIRPERFRNAAQALSNAMREELIGRNVTCLVEAPLRGHFDVEP
jgi:hypothetical protein